MTSRCVADPEYILAEFNIRSDWKGGLERMVGSKIRSESQAPVLRNHWVARNVSWLKSTIRIILGIAWLFDGYL
ncbi:MAG TPA: hypothetical protein VE177_03610, partial [Candidatus Binatus sp.]|nr:hypothetical protein [Candidatus Binatus sp.]